jgi:hypothetical protein
MSQMIAQETCTREFFSILDEAFETHHGIFLDRGTLLFDTLAGISAAEASIPVGGKCAPLAAQVTHVIFYLGVAESCIYLNLLASKTSFKISRASAGVAQRGWT